MNDIIKLGRSNVSFLKFESFGTSYPKTLTSSEDGFLAILHNDSLTLGTIGFQPLSEDRKYVLTHEKIELDFKLSDKILVIEDFDFEKAINKKEITDDVIYRNLLDFNYSITRIDENKPIKYCCAEWSPLDPLENKSFLAVMTFDGRIILMGQNKCTNIWQKEFDMLELYYQYYKEHLLSLPCSSDGVVSCRNVKEYMMLKKDLRLISFSWSSLVRHSEKNQYCLLSLLSESGIVTIWSVVNDQLGSHCRMIFKFDLNTQLRFPNIIHFCDISKDMFLITCSYSDEKIIGYLCDLRNVKDNSSISIEKRSELITINHQTRYIQANKFYWSMKHLILFVGFESELLIAKLDISTEGNYLSSAHWLELPSHDQITGIVVKQNVVYVTSHEGFLYGIKLDTNIENIELNEILFDVAELNCNNEFLSVFLSPNGVHLGLLNLNVDKLMKPEKGKKPCDIALIRLMPERELLNILMDDNKPFCRKQDAVEEMRHLYLNNKHLLHSALHKLSKSESQWDSSTLHNLQLARYLCIFFGYQLNLNKDIPDITGNNLDFSKIRKLESIIISRNISYRLDSFSESTSPDFNKDDCLFVLSISLKLRMATDNSEIIDSIEVAQNKARSLLVNEFGVDETEISRHETTVRRFVCPVCEDNGEFNLFASKCPKHHIFPRCCKTLEICTDKMKVCVMCGANECFIETNGLSNWRMEIIKSNCPLCDGKFTESKS